MNNEENMQDLMFWTSPSGKIYSLSDIVSISHSKNKVIIHINGKEYQWTTDVFPKHADALIERWKKVKMLVAGLHADRNYAAQDFVEVEYKNPAHNLSGAKTLLAWSKATDFIAKAGTLLVEAPSREINTGSIRIEQRLVETKEKLEAALIEINKIL